MVTQENPYFHELQGRNIELSHLSERPNCYEPVRGAIPKTGGTSTFMDLEDVYGGYILTEIFTATEFDLVSRISEADNFNVLIMGFGLGFDLYAFEYQLDKLKKEELI